MPPHPDAVEAARLTGHARYLELCDPDHPAYNPDYLPVVAKIARGVEPTAAQQSAGSFTPARTLPPVLRLPRSRWVVLNTCFYLDRNCSCGPMRCAWKKRAVTPHECQECHP